MLDSPVRETSRSRNVGAIPFRSHLLVHLRELGGNFVQAVALVNLRLDITLSIRLLLEPLLRTALCEFAATARVVVLHVVIHAAVFSSRLDGGLRALNSHVLVEVVLEYGVISLRED